MKYNIGDKVICLPGFNTDGNWENKQSGGRGWKLNKIFIISSITTNSGCDDILWPKGGGSGVFSQAVKLYNEEPNYEIY